MKTIHPNENRADLKPTNFKEPQGAVGEDLVFLDLGIVRHDGVILERPLDLVLRACSLRIRALKVKRLLQHIHRHIHRLSCKQHIRFIG